MLSVVQDWVFELPLMQQTVLIELTRGPDGIAKYDPSKYLVRWARRCFLRLALNDGAIVENPWDPRGQSFTGPSYDARVIEASTGTIIFDEDWQPRMDEIVDKYLKGVDAMPHHYHLHLMHGIEILGFKHPNHEICLWWRKTYHRFVHDMHLWAETEEQMDRRLGGTVEGWLARADPATIA